MATIGKIGINLDANSASFSKGAQQVTKDLANISNQVDHLKRSAAGSDVFDKLRESLGRRSALGEATEIFQGGGRVLGGLTGAADAIKNMATQAKQLKQEFAAGKLSAGELTEKLIESVPVVGQFWQAGRAIRELFTNEGADLEFATEQAKSLDAALKAQKGTYEILKNEARSYADFMEEIAHRIAQTQLQGEAKSREAAQHEANVEKETLQKEREAKLKEIADLNKPALDAARKTQQDANVIDTHFLSGHVDEEAMEAKRVAALTASTQAQSILKTQREAEATINAIYDRKQIEAAKAAAMEEQAEHEKVAAESAKKRAEDGERDAKAIADAQTGAQATILEGQGKHLEAETLLLKQALADRLEAIRKETEEEIAGYELSGDAANQAAVLKVQAAKEAAAQSETAAKIASAAKDAQDKKDEEKLKLQEDIQSRREKKQSEADKYIDVGPAQKFADELQKINELKEQGYLNDKQAAAAKAKLNQELIDSAPQSQQRNVGAESRRFDFILAAQPTPQDPIAALKALQEKQLQSAKQSEFYEQQLYNMGLLASNPLVADF